MEAEESRGRPRGEGKGQPAEKVNAPRPRPPGGAPPRTQDDARRKRPSERRYAGWGDSVERLMCARDIRRLPAAFPVESRAGAATIAVVVVARRDNAVLLCAFAHAGPHEWPDGEESYDSDFDHGQTPTPSEG